MAQRLGAVALDRGGLLFRIKNAASILIPLFISTIRRAEELALAMESRCWRGGKERTRLRELRFTELDAALSGLLAGLLVAVWLL